MNDVHSTCTTVQVYSRPSALMETSPGGLSVIKGYFDEVLPYRRTEEEQFVRRGRGEHAHCGQGDRHKAGFCCRKPLC